MEENPKRVVAYVLNLFDHKLDLPCEIIPGFILRGVTDQERLAISRLMRLSGTAPHNFAHHYESKLDFNNGISRVPESEPSSWRYYVIEYPLVEDDFFDSTWPPPRKLTSFRYAAIVSDANFIWGYTTFAGPRTTLSQSLSERVLKMAISYSGKASDHEANHANPDHGLAMIQAHLIVSCRGGAICKASQRSVPQSSAWAAPGSPWPGRNGARFPKYGESLPKGRSCLTH